MSTIRTELQKRAQAALLQYALLRWENAVIIAGTLLLTVLLPYPFSWWPVWGWPLVGLAALLILVYSSLSDREANAKVLLELFQEQFNPRQIQSKELRQEVESALEYQRRIEAQVRSQRAGVMRDRIEETAGQLSDWVSNVFRLAQRLDAYRQDDLLLRDQESVPQEIETLVARRKLESNATVQRQIDQVLESKGKQWQALRALDDRMRQADLQLQQSLTALATVYSQVQLISVQDVESGRAARLQADIKEQVERLNDLVSSINEVYDYRTKGLG